MIHLIMTFLCSGSHIGISLCSFPFLKFLGFGVDVRSFLGENFQDFRLDFFVPFSLLLVPIFLGPLDFPKEGQVHSYAPLFSPLNLRVDFLVHKHVD